MWCKLWAWLPRRPKAPVRRRPSALQLAVESLEDRLVPSTSSSDAAYQAWRQQSFRVDDAALSTITINDQVMTAAVPTNSTFGNLIGLPGVFTSTPYRGDGYSVAIIDTGIDYNNPNLGGGFGPGHRVIAGWDFVNNDANPMDDNGHGTHVAGIIGSSNATYSGVAPNVNLIALKVLDASGAGSFGNVENALQWVVANRARYNIVAINLSLGAGNYTANPFTFMDDEFTALKNNGVLISVAAGNSFYSNNSAVGLDYPAVDPLVVSVGAVWSGNFGPVAWASGARDNSTAADRVASFSQRGPALSIVAPGAIITSTYLNNTFRGMAGTSMASPVVAGASVLIHQAMDSLSLSANQDTILNVMRRTGVNAVDGDDENDNVTNTGLTFKRLDLNAALGSLRTTNAAPVLQPLANMALAPGGTRVITLGASDADGDPISFAASIAPANPPLAYQLKQQLGLTYPGSYYQNIWGMNEKWMHSASGNWYAILPSGQLRRWGGSAAATLQPVNLIATLDARFYADPSLLWNAPAPPMPALSIAGNQLTIRAPSNAEGNFVVQVTASDGRLFATQSFVVAVQSTTAPQGAFTLAGDFNADGLQDAAVLNAGGSWWVGFRRSDGVLVQQTWAAWAAPTNWAVLKSGDFNGDGKADVLAFDNAGSLWVGITSAGRFTLARWTQWATASLWSSLGVADVNGDGKADFFGKYTNGRWYVAYSTGTTFRTELWAAATSPS